MMNKQQYVIGERPADVPANWAIYNAPRPIYGTSIWRGDFVTGRFYAAVDPADPEASWMHKENATLDATILLYVTEENAIRAVLAYWQERYPAMVADLDPADHSTRTALRGSFMEQAEKLAHYLEDGGPVTYEEGYQEGYQDGRRDGEILRHPPNTGGHTFAEYQRIEATYKEAIYSFTPSEYQRGYGNGLDDVAIEAGIEPGDYAEKEI